MIHLVNGIAESWFWYMASATFQATLLALFILGVLRIGCRWPPALRHAILMLALCKFLIPPMLSLPTGVFNRIQPREWSDSAFSLHYVALAVQNVFRLVANSMPLATPTPSGMNALKADVQPGVMKILPPPSIQKPTLAIKGKLFLLHISGALLILAMAALQQFYLRRLAFRAAPVKDPNLTETYDSLCRNMKPLGRPQLLISGDNHAPITFGAWKPVVMLPQALVAALPPLGIRIILGHELAHHRRWDPWLAWLQVIISAFWWFNPVYWLLSRSIRSVREDCCDDMVVASGIASREIYCRTLLQAARVTFRNPMAGAALAYFGESQPLQRRFKRIMSAKSICFPKLAGTGMLAVFALGLLLLPGGKPRVLAQISAPAGQHLASWMPAVQQATEPVSVSAPQSQPAPQKASSDYYRKWLDEDVVYIITPEEKNAFLALRTDEKHDSFIEQFWARRDTDPQSKGSFKAEHYRRLAYANEHFASSMPGWKTDCGRIYIIWGKPDEIESHPRGGAYNRLPDEGGGTADTFPFEKWWYRHIDGVGDDIEIEFVDPSGTGEYRMAMSPKEKYARINVPNGELTPMVPPAKDSPFSRMEQYFAGQRPPQTTFEDLKAVVTTYVNDNFLPYDVRTDYIPLSTDKVLVPITVELYSKDLEFLKEQDFNRATVNVHGTVTNLAGGIVVEWEDVISVEYLDQYYEQGKSKRSEYQKVIGLPLGQHFKLDLMLKDINSKKTGARSIELNIPKHKNAARD